MDLTRTATSAAAPATVTEVNVEILSPYGQVPIFSRVRRGTRESFVLTYSTGSIEAWREEAPLGLGFSRDGRYIGGVEVHSARSDSGRDPSHTDCILVPGGTCWHDGSSLAFDQAQLHFSDPDGMQLYLQTWAMSHLDLEPDTETIEAGTAFATLTGGTA